jgi:vanillate O-demethylase ferredoxin subunit
MENVMAQASPETHLYVCGPGGFIDFVVNSARQRGWSSERIHFEYFSAALQETSSDRPFDVRLAGSGKTYTIPANKTVIAVLAEHGIELPVSCEQGVCGTCITRVKEGIPDHRDMYFTEEEHAMNDQFTPCCSRAKSAVLVLDIC